MLKETLQTAFQIEEIRCKPRVMPAVIVTGAGQQAANTVFFHGKHSGLPGQINSSHLEYLQVKTTRIGIFSHRVEQAVYHRRAHHGLLFRQGIPDRYRRSPLIAGRQPQVINRCCRNKTVGDHL